MATVLVVGGAGYIGSHMVLALRDAGYDIVVLDNLNSGHRDAVLAGTFVLGDLGDPAVLDTVFATYPIEAVLHFAAHIEVGESVTDPGKYYRNNTASTQVLLDRMLAHGVKRFIFSSTAAIFGEPHYTPIDEAHPCNPINPYGRSKWMVEQMLEDYDHAYGLKAVALRYFNAAGADPQTRVGERHHPETHLIPLILQAAAGRRADIKIFGTDYDTPDGTCLRDYIHVADLAQAHILALRHLLDGGDSDRFNLGNGVGFSVREVIDTVREVTGRAFTVVESPRRQGDPARLVADSSRAMQQLGWTPHYADIATIVAHAWAFDQQHHGG